MEGRWVLANGLSAFVRAFTLSQPACHHVHQQRQRDRGKSGESGCPDFFFFAKVEDADANGDETTWRYSTRE